MANWCPLWSVSGTQFCKFARFKRQKKKSNCGMRLSGWMGCQPLPMLLSAKFWKLCYAQSKLHSPCNISTNQWSDFCDTTRSFNKTCFQFNLQTHCPPEVLKWKFNAKETESARSQKYRKPTENANPNQSRVSDKRTHTTSSYSSLITTHQMWS
jgi:hypothetical protein